MSARVILLWAWATILVGPLALVLAGPGVLAHRDMLVLDHPALTGHALGLHDAARATPQDAVLAVIGAVVPASWVVRLLLVAGACAAVGAAVVWARRAAAGPWATALAMLVACWSPAVLERLAQGHWSLVLCGWLLPGIVYLGLTRRYLAQWALMWPATLSPTGAVFAVLAGAASSRGRALPVGVVLCLPWLVPSLVSPGAPVSAESVRAFAPRDGWALFGGSGIWNADLSAGAPVWVGVALACVLLAGWRGLPPGVAFLGVVAIGVPLFAVLAPGAWEWVLTTIPGAGLARDAHKFLLLGIPAAVILAAHIRPAPVAAVGLVLACANLVGAPAQLAALRPAALDTPHSACAEGTVFLPGATTLIDGPLINPWFKTTDALYPGGLRVDGVVVDKPTQEWADAADAWEARDLARLRELGVGTVVDPATGECLAKPGGKPPTRWPALLLLAAWWLVIPLTAGYSRRALTATRGRKQR